MTEKSDESKKILSDEHLADVVGGYYGVYTYNKGDTFRKDSNAFVVTEDCPFGEKVRVTACAYWEDDLWIGSDLDEYLPNSWFENAGYVYIGNNVLKFK